MKFYPSNTALKLKVGIPVMILSKNNKILIGIGLVVLSLLVFRFFTPEDNWVCQNGQWVKHGKPSIPEPKSGCGQNIQQVVITVPSNPNFRNLNFQPNQEIFSPLVIKGEARGNWFFEASFPVILTDWDGKIIAQGVAQAKGDWMTANFVPFEATLEFIKPNVKNNGSLILKKDNPSGLPQNDAAYEIPITFK